MNKKKQYQVINEIRLDADLYYFLKSVSKNREDSSIEKYLNEILREKFEEEEKKLSKYKDLRSELLNDTEFLQELKEKLAA